jgi:inositol transport system ATP-binding protein
MNNETLVALRNISKSFPGVRALDDVSFDLKKGVVHGIAGENGAGKSTLMKILSGTYTNYEGKILLDGAEIHFKNEHDALDAGISIVPQELNPIPDLTIAENIFIGREPIRFKGFLDKKKRTQAARESLSFLGLDYDPDQKIKYLSVAEKQMVEIIKAITRNARIIIMDEPSSALTTIEIDQLLRQIKRLKSEGISIFYITHKLEEIFSVCDELTVLRDGKHISTSRIEEVTIDRVISMMVGRDIKDVFPLLADPGSEVLMSVDNYSSKGVFSDISFALRKGEVLGFAGMMGAGRSEIVRSLFGLDPHTSGTISMANKRITIMEPRDAISAQIGMVTEDRAQYGFIPRMSVKDNIALPNCDTFAPRLILKSKLIRRVVDEICRRIRIKTPRLETFVMNLSGGNQQKVVLAKWLVRDMKVLILDEPTRGIDVGAKQEIYGLIKQFSEAGMGIILITSELPEILALSHRLLVIADGKIVGQLNRNEASQDAVMKMIIRGGA